VRRPPPGVAQHIQEPFRRDRNTAAERGMRMALGGPPGAGGSAGTGAAGASRSPGGRRGVRGIPRLDRENAHFQLRKEPLG